MSVRAASSTYSLLAFSRVWASANHISAQDYLRAPSYENHSSQMRTGTDDDGTPRALDATKGGGHVDLKSKLIILISHM